MPGRVARASSSQPGGVGTEMPQPLSSQTKQQGHLETLVDGVTDRVEGADGRRVVGRGVTEAGHHHGVVGPRRAQAEASTASEREGQAEGSRQVGGDRRGLRDDVEGRVAEDLVPAARDRVVGARHQAEQHVGHGVDPHLGRPGAVERARPIVQQGRVGRPQRQGHGGVGLVAGRGDRVEPLARRLQRPSGKVEVAAQGLGVEEGDQLGCRLRRLGLAGDDGGAEGVVEARHHRANDAGSEGRWFRNRRQCLRARADGLGADPGADRARAGPARRRGG